MKMTILIKKYSNRKLYDTSSGKYTTLDEMVELMRTGFLFKVIDNVTKEDITYRTQIQMLLEKEKRVVVDGDLELIRRLIVSTESNFTESIKKLDTNDLVENTFNKAA